MSRMNMSGYSNSPILAIAFFCVTSRLDYFVIWLAWLAYVGFAENAISSLICVSLLAMSPFFSICWIGLSASTHAPDCLPDDSLYRYSLHCLGVNLHWPVLLLYRFWRHHCTCHRISLAVVHCFYNWYLSSWLPPCDPSSSTTFLAYTRNLWHFLPQLLYFPVNHFFSSGNPLQSTHIPGSCNICIHSRLYWPMSPLLFCPICPFSCARRDTTDLLQ